MGLVFAIFGLIFSVLLYANLKTDIEELLPDTARSVRDLVQADSRLFSMENIVVLIFSSDTVASKKFVDDLAQNLSKVPKSTISRVEYKIDKEVKFFKDRQALFMDLSDLLRIKDYVQKKIKYETTQRRHHSLKNNINLVEPKLNLEEFKAKYKKTTADFDRYPQGYYATADEKIRAVVVYMPGKGLDLGHKMKDVIAQAIGTMNPKSYAPDLEVRYTGNVQNMLEESAALVEDLVLSTVIVTVLVVVVMLLFFQSTWATLLLVCSLFMGTFWTFGLAYLIIGYLNANTAFLASIVIGNGINFGIIFLARYLEERRRGHNNSAAIHTSMSKTMTATGTAALAAGFSYGSLMMTGFRGFSQFGVIGLIGMILCWLSAYTVLPAFLTLLDTRTGGKWLEGRKTRMIASHILASWVKRVPNIIVLTSILGVALSLLAFTSYKHELIETDLSKLRDKRSMISGSGAFYHYIDDIFGHSVSPMVILAEKRDDAKKIAALFRDEQNKQGQKSLITTVQDLDDFLPTNQREKVKVITEIGDLLTPDILKNISPDERNFAELLINPAGKKPFREQDLPPMVLVRFQEANGSLGTVVLVDKQIERDGDSSSALTYFVDLGRKLTDSVEWGAPVAGGLPVSFDMYQSIVSDGPKATLFAFLAVVVLVIVLFRNVRIISLALLALFLGVTWLAGLIVGFHLKINFLNFIALPITFGIGIDYGINIFQRYREDGAKNIVKVVRNTGGAVMLCSFTTIIGYSSLLIAGNQAFVSFGRLAVFGELTCVTAAVVSLPAFLICFKPKRAT